MHITKEKKNVLIITANANLAIVKAVPMFSLQTQL